MNFQYAAFADESNSSFDGQMDALVRNGIPFMEMRFVDGRYFTQLTVQEAKAYQNRLADKGLAVWSMGSPIGKIGIHDDFDAHMELYKHTLELAGVFGAKNVRLFSFFMPKDENPGIYRNLVLDRMAIFAETAKAFGVYACHENEKGIYGDNAARCLEIYRAVPELKGVFDPANFVQCGQDTLEAWQLLHPYIYYLHIKDALADGQVVPAGQGIGNVPAIVEAYGRQGGSVMTLEPHLNAFIGLAGLEREGDTSVVGGLAFESSEAAFDCAANSMKKIAEGIV